MSLLPGHRLGPYEILAPLGAGGMGEVYRARDTRLDRTVAVKILPSQLASSPELRARLEREARAVSSLNHPHICTLHDIGSHEGIDFLVMEHIEGETLAARIEKGPLPPSEALRCAIQITDALDRAHRHGIVHRDLKPGNIMLTRAGAKLLDFGLARRIGSGSSLGATASPTMTSPLTAEGAIVGTFQYMAPEQLEGKEADARSDIFSLGAVLYEMVTGKKAFGGASQASVIAAILDREPAPISTIQPMSPPGLERIVTQCLVKDPDERWQSAGDLKRELQWVIDGGSQAGLAAPAASRGRAREPLAWAVAGALAVALAVVGFMTALRPAPPETIPLRFTIPPPEKAKYDLTMALSPDGRHLAFVATLEGRRHLWVRSLDSFESRALPRTEGASMPFWSPDGRHIGFFAEGKLKRVDTTDGSIQPLAPASDPRGGSWGPDGVILFSPSTIRPIQRISATGGEVAPATALDSSLKESSHRWPWFLPDGRHFLYFARSGDKDAEAIYVASLDTTDRTRLLPAHSAAAYASPGFLLYVREASLMAQPFDPVTLSLSGEAMTVAQNVELVGENGPTAYAAFSAAGNGLLAYLQSGSMLTNQPIWFDRAGRPARSAAPPGFYDEPALSPDSRRVVLGLTDPKSGRSSQWLLDLSQEKPSRFTFGDADDSSAVWSPDGGRIAYGSNRSGFWDLYWKLSSGVAGEELLLSTSSHKFPDAWSADGRLLVYEDNDPNTGVDLWILQMSAERVSTPYLRTTANEAHAQISPDGRWLAYVSDESGRSEIYVQTFPNPGGKFQISTEGGDQPLWRRDGKELFYISEDHKLMAVAVTSGSVFEAGPSSPLFEVRMPPGGVTSARIRYAAAADGQRFLVLSFTEDAASSPIRIITDWTAGLRK